MANTPLTDPVKPAEGRNASLRQLVLFAGVCLCVFGYLAASLFYTLPSNALSSRQSKGAARHALNILTPENWAFFTRDPETAQIGVYALGADGAGRNLLRTPQGAPSNLFGLSRTQRAQGPELGYLNAATAAHWMACDGRLDDCLRESSGGRVWRVKNESPVPTVCGNAYLTQEKTVPWSYRELVPYSRRIVKIAHLDIRCR
ncbi:SdpA family antimicrobial peptide system protein [Streptomyces lydicus]|uniref:SdpA family antimicrobial peptide system protein n=1 Tax=Streptomyces lydicus TaxID=47763 RepID=UPI0010133F74|nr:SdpA family antimicrobial peptide system protein [Streptomyces lydicus]MCZ1009799.1 SdpA family antimicrobial peptide system protein [Streptomyces lydicus]